MKQFIIRLDQTIYGEAIQKFLHASGMNADGKLYQLADAYPGEALGIKVDIDRKDWSYSSLSWYGKHDFTFPDDYTKIIEALTPKIEVGSYVRLKEDGGYLIDNHSKYKKGDIFKVGELACSEKYAREFKNDGNGVHLKLLELVTKADYDAYIAAKTPKLTFGGVKVEISKEDGDIYVNTQGVTGTLDQIEAIVDELTGKNVRVFRFGAVELKSWRTNQYDCCIPNMLNPGEIVKEVTIGCTTGTLEELKAIIEAGNKLK